MPKGEDKVRMRYSRSGMTHPNRSSKKKTGFEGNNWPSSRTFYSDVSVEVIMIAQKFRFYCYLSGLPPQGEAKYTLEKIAKEIGYPVSNYTIEGLCNPLWGPRHNPTPKTLEAITRLTDWLQVKCKELNIWKPFKFSPHQEDKQKPKDKKENECKTESRSRGSRRKEISIEAGGEEEADDSELGNVDLPRRTRQGKGGQTL